VPLLAILAFAAVAIPATASAADRTVRLTLDPSSAACTWDAQLDCSYLETRNGNQPAPDPTDPAATAPTFLNLANLPGPIELDAIVHDDGTVTVPDGNVDWPDYVTTLQNPLVGEVTVTIRFAQTGDWTGTFDETTGAVDLTAPLGLSFSLACDPASPTLCSAVFGATGNMGTWAVRSASGPVELTTGHQDAVDPPAAYGPAWIGPVAEDGDPYDAGDGDLTLIGNGQVLHRLEPTDCVDPTSVACMNPGIGGLVLPPLNDAIGATATEDTVPGAIDMRLTFDLTEPVTSNPSEVDFGEQLEGRASEAKTVTITAPSVGQVEIRRLFNEGGDDADFWIANDQCGSVVPAGESCNVRIRFTPSGLGARSTDLTARIVSPISGDPETIPVATLKGTGVEEPLPPPPVRSIRPEILPKVFARVSGSGKVVVGKVRCPEGECTVVPRRVRFRAGGKSIGVRLRAPNEVAEGKRAKLRAVLGNRGERLLDRAGKGKVNAKVRVRSTNGTSAQRTFQVKVRPKG
jgi:hypothetical protein